MSVNTYKTLNSFIRKLYAENDRDKSLDIAIKIANEFLRIIFPKNTIGKAWGNKLLEGDDLLDEVIPVKHFPNQKVETWFEKHPYLGGERTALNLFIVDNAPIEGRFYWLNKSSTKTRIAAGVALTPNWEDGDLYKLPKYKIGIDFFLTADCDALLVALSNEGRLRILELSEQLTNTQIEILHDIDGAIGFDGIGDSEPQRTIHKTLWDAFALKEVNKRFYEGIAQHFNILLQHLTKVDKKSESDAKLFANRLIGRLLFIWFLRKKGFINENIGYFDYENIPATEYYNTILKKLFFSTLNKPKDSDERCAINGFIDSRTPFLNGGLFDPRPNDWVEEIVDFPPDWFESMFHHFEQFNFTTDESTPEYEQVAIDPEMLGRVFENLLASQLDETGKEARKASGSFYTPREIVAYMCKESLRQYLYKELSGEGNQEGVDRLLDTPDHEFEVKHSDAKKSLWGAGRTKEMTAKTIAALDKLRILDPACGSGAFPMGMLQLLTKVYTRLGSTLNPYDMKLQILGNNIYGIDIQPMAVEISRLRAWLSIVVDEKDPQNVRPLPNLDFKFVCANTLVPLVENKKNTGQMNEFEILDASPLETLDSIMNKGYYSATDPEQKKILKDEYHYALVKLEKRSSAQGDQLRRRMAWNPFDLNESSGFFDSETMFNVTDGFDIAIANPPYIQLQKMKDVSAKLYKPLDYETFESTGDIYSLFYERGFDLLRPGGILCYITSNKWMRAAYGKSLRDFFLTKTNPIKLIDFAGTKVFESATVDVNILLGSKADNIGSLAATIIHNDCQNNLSDYVKQHAVASTFAKGESWTVLSEIEQSIKRKIETVGIPLKEWDISINYGIKTGCNEAFIIDGATKERLIAEDPRSAEIIRPILRGRDIKRYGYDFKDLWLIASHNGYKKDNRAISPIDINNYPAVKAHLDQYWDAISKRGDKGVTPYNLRNCAYMDDFSKQKIIWGNLCRSSQFTFVENNYFINAPSSMIVPGNKYILAILNSAVGDWYIRQLGVTRNGSYFEYKPMFIEKLPIPQLDEKQQDIFVKTVDSLLAAKESHSNSILFEESINQLVYNLYGLTHEEILYIRQ